MHLRNFGSVVARFLCTQAQVYGFAARSFFPSCFPTYCKARQVTFALSTHKSLLQPKTAHRFAKKAPNPLRPQKFLISFPRHGYCNAFFFFFFFVGTAFFESFCFCWLSLLCVHGEREDGLRGSGLAKVRSQGVF